MRAKKVTPMHSPAATATNGAAKKHSGSGSTAALIGAGVAAVVGGAAILRTLQRKAKRARKTVAAKASRAKKTIRASAKRGAKRGRKLVKVVRAKVVRAKDAATSS